MRSWRWKEIDGGDWVGYPVGDDSTIVQVYSNAERSYRVYLANKRFLFDESDDARKFVERTFDAAERIADELFGR